MSEDVGVQRCALAATASTSVCADPPIRLSMTTSSLLRERERERELRLSPPRRVRSVCGSFTVLTDGEIRAIGFVSNQEGNRA